MRNLIPVELDLIEPVDRSELDQRRLDLLEHGADAFDVVLHSTSNPIALDLPGPPYQIQEGRHRVYLARQHGYTHVQAHCLWLEVGVPLAATTHRPHATVSAPALPILLTDVADDDVTKDMRETFAWFFKRYFLIIFGLLGVIICGLLAAAVLLAAFLRSFQ